VAGKNEKFFIKTWKNFKCLKWSKTHENHVYIDFWWYFLNYGPSRAGKNYIKKAARWKGSFVTKLFKKNPLSKKGDRGVTCFKGENVRY